MTLSSSCPQNETAVLKGLNVTAGTSSLNYSIVPTNNQLVAATDCSGCCLERCLHRTKRTVVVVNTERNPLAVWDAYSRICSGKGAIEPNTTTQISTIAVSSRTVRHNKVQHSYDTTSLIVAGVIPHDMMKGILLANTTETSDVNNLCKDQ